VCKKKGCVVLCCVKERVNEEKEKEEKGGRKKTSGRAPNRGAERCPGEPKKQAGKKEDGAAGSGRVPAGPKQSATERKLDRFRGAKLRGTVNGG